MRNREEKPTSFFGQFFGYLKKGIHFRINHVLGNIELESLGATRLLSKDPAGFFKNSMFGLIIVGVFVD